MSAAESVHSAIQQRTTGDWGAVMVGVLLLAFLFYVTAKGHLPQYLGAVL